MKKELSQNRIDGRAAVYVIEIKDGITKIGFSREPSKRLDALQIGQPQTIRLLACFWLPETQARKAEALVHKKLRNDVRRLAGEIYCFDSEQAQGIIKTALASLGINVPEKVSHQDVDDGGRYGCNGWLTRLGVRGRHK